jgi:ATP-dependent DNA helicase
VAAVDPSLFPVVVTTYEVVIRDRALLQHFKWKYIIVDEGHRLKNMKCQLVRELNVLAGGSVLVGGANKLLLTGTPLQNNLTELWSLLNFLMPEVRTFRSQRSGVCALLLARQHIYIYVE